MNQFHFHKLFISLACISLTACSTVNGTLQNGRYTSASKQLSVNVPALAEVSPQDLDTGNYTTVAFTSGKYYWMMDGQYVVDSIKPTKKFDLAKELPITMKRIIKDEKQADLKIEQCKHINIHSSAAYQCIGKLTVNTVPAIYVGTSFMMNGRVVNVFGLEPTMVDGKPSSFHWGRYSGMINSIRVQ